MAAVAHKRKISFADLEATIRPHPTAPAPPYQVAQAAPPQLTQAQQDLQRREELRRREASYRQARKPTDRNISDDVAKVVIGDGVDRYRSLRAVERKLDVAMMQKRLDIAETLPSQIRREATLRLWISNTADGQPWQMIDDAPNDAAFDFGDNSQATYRVKIEGRLLDHPDSHEANVPLKMSHFFKYIIVEFDRPPVLQPDHFSSIEWEQPPNPDLDSDFDCLEFERKGDEEMQVTINLVRHEIPERYKLSKPMATLIHAQEADRATVVAGIWEYVRARGLLEDDEHRKIVCDDQLRAIFGMDTLYFPYMPELIHHHLSPLDPIKLPYTIRVDKAYIAGDMASKPTIYDIRVPLPSAIKQTMQDMIADPRHLSTLKSIISIDADLALLVSQINSVDAKRRFHDDLARDPAGFIKRWMSSQQRDLDVVLAEGGRGVGDTRDDGLPLDVFRKGGEQGVWAGNVARESVGLWLARSKSGVH